MDSQLNLVDSLNKLNADADLIKFASNRNDDISEFYSYLKLNHLIWLANALNFDNELRKCAVRLVRELPITSKLFVVDMLDNNESLEALDAAWNYAEGKISKLEMVIKRDTVHSIGWGNNNDFIWYPAWATTLEDAIDAVYETKNIVTIMKTTHTFLHALNRPYAQQTQAMHEVTSLTHRLIRELITIEMVTKGLEDG